MRDCPTVEGSSIPLIMHRIAVSSCLERQSCNYHKCHRCIFRGKAANWAPDDHAARPQVTPTVAQREVPRTVEVPRPDRKPPHPGKPGAPSASKPAVDRRRRRDPKATPPAAARP